MLIHPFSSEPTIEWYHEILYFFLKRFKGAISYSDFFEMYDDDVWILYELEQNLIKEEEREFNKAKSAGDKGKIIIDDDVPPEDPRAAEFVMDIIGD